MGMTTFSGRRLRAAASFVAAVLVSCTALEQQHAVVKIDHLNPPGMHANPAFSQAICVEGPHRTLYIGGQNAVNADGQIVGVGEIAEQATQVARNIKTVLAAAEAGPEAVVQWNVHVVEGQELLPAMQAFHRELAGPTKPATVTVLYVSGLAHPEFLLEVNAVAVLPSTDM